MTTVTAQSLAHHPFLRGMAGEHLSRLATVARKVVIPGQHRMFEEGDVADRFWLLQGGPVALDLVVPGEGRVVVESLGMGDVLGWSWLFPPHRWHFGAKAMSPLTAIELDGRAVRAMCDEDPAFGYALTNRFLAVVLHRLQASRVRLVERQQVQRDLDWAG